MARLQLLFPLLFWIVWDNNRDTFALGMPLIGTAAYFSMLAGILAFVWLRMRQVMRRTSLNAVGGVPQFHKVLFAARWAMLLAHGVALFVLGYGQIVLKIVPDFHKTAEALPAFASLLPFLVAWLGLLSLQYPFERAIREQNALYAFEFGEPVHMAPTRWQFIITGFRQQILVTLLPMVIVAGLRDGLQALARPMHFAPTAALDLGLSLGAVAVVFIFAPEILRRVLSTESLPPSPLRTRLENICKDLGLNFRDILLWKTHHTLANAAVMGVFPQVRYVLLSDRLIETMTDEQTEAVFAHEAGHIVHRHLAWYSAFFIVFIIAMSGAEQFAEQWQMNAWVLGGLEIALGIACFFGGFGALSRSFERQADVFATRCVPVTAIDAPVAPAGVAVFSAALLAVARLNNMPIHSSDCFGERGRLSRLFARVIHHTGSWLHGSIRSRIDYLEQLPGNPAASERFDRTMFFIRVALIVALGASAVWVFTSMR